MQRSESRLGFAVVLVWCGAVAFAAAAEPHVGYIYPAGARQGTTLEVTVGGQFLKDATNLYVTGGGFEARVVSYFKMLTNKQINRLRNRLQKLEQTLDGTEGEERARLETEIQNIRDTIVAQGFDESGKKRTKRPDRKKQPNAQLAEQVTLELRVAPEAPEGVRELRIITAAGLSNPFLFHVDHMPEQREQEPNDLDPVEGSALSLPGVMHGQIMPGDVDRFGVLARKGQRLNIAVEARSLIPYLADAVPGWFQATLALYDPAGNEVAYADDHHFDPDPVLVYDVPADGTYVLEIKDAIYRGREDFVYRITLGEDSPPPPGMRDHGRIRSWAASCEPVREKEPNDHVGQAQPVADPVLITGRIGQPGDWDVFRVKGQAGEELVAEVWARRLGTPVDSVIRLVDAHGNQVGFNDDRKDVGAGLTTHHADAYLSCRLPADGDYFLQVGDIQHKGGADYHYRLRLGPPQPDFELRVVPASINVPAGGTAPVTVHSLRLDGFEGPIDLTLLTPAHGFSVSGGVIPAGQDRLRMTLTAPRRRLDEPVRLELEGHAVIDGRDVRRPALASDDMMQAFLWRHLVAARTWMAAVTPFTGLPLTVDASHGDILKIPAGGTAKVTLHTRGKGDAIRRATFELDDPPEGLSLLNTDYGGDANTVTLVLNADAEALNPGRRGNLILTGLAKAKAKGKRRRVMGLSPAIPYEIVGP